MTDEEFEAFIVKTAEELEAKQDSLMAKYGLGQHSGFQYDQPTGKLQFIDASGKVRIEAAATPIGSFSAKTGTWQWAWANDSVLEPLRRRAEKLKELSALTGIDTFDMPTLNVTEAMAWEMAGMAVNLLGALGCYRIPTGHLQVFLAIDSVRQLDAN